MLPFILTYNGCFQAHTKQNTEPQNTCQPASRCIQLSAFLISSILSSMTFSRLAFQIDIVFKSYYVLGKTLMFSLNFINYLRSHSNERVIANIIYCKKWNCYRENLKCLLKMFLGRKTSNVVGFFFSLLIVKLNSVKQNFTLFGLGTGMS